ncbi:MAG: nucleotide sugar dehydrogenase, partial [Sphingomonadales bacterium]|nr:nucleotide sugar dehydrogenase [Sphingomonadales bacterium]
MSSTLATTKDPIAVIGLGYVGLPLAIHLAKKFDVIGFDISAERVKELKGGFDRTDEVEDADLKNSALRYSCDTGDIKDARIYIVTVPTPVHDNNEPDLGPVLGASRMLAEIIKKGDIVVYESTVYPGVTDEQCGPVLEEISGLECGVDFFLGYSPERINPGDRVHTVDKITKVVAGQTDEVRDILCDMYGAITSGGTFPASSIRVAEAAKVIENAQRDVNIAFVNEIAMIFQKLGISTSD